MLKNKSLKQRYREHGFEVNRDDQKGIGNAAIEAQHKVIREWIEHIPTRAMIFEADGLSIHLIRKKNLLEELNF